MIYKNAARVIALAAFLFAAPQASAHREEGVTGVFYADCFPSDGAAVTIELSNHIRITTFGASVKPDDAYRTKEQKFTEEEPTTMYVFKCDDKMDNCKEVEGVLSTYKSDSETIEATLEFFDGTETQGDSESIEGHTALFSVKPDTKRPPAKCN